MENLPTSITVSIIALGVIFITLSILIAVINALVYWMPYVAPSSPLEKRKPVSAGDAEISEHVAAIHAAVAHHMGKHPEEIQISDIRPL